jgi:ankyrin repeat protein
VKDNDGGTPMHWAAIIGHVDAIKVLKELGTDVSAKDNDGGMPMHWAAISGHDGAIKALQELGADVSAKDNDGWTPLDVAKTSLSWPRLTS